jgi:hypothetical protein
MFNYNDNPILVDVNSRRNRKQKINCVLCKIELTCINPEERRYKCSRCKNTYQLGGYEILPQEDELESSHEEDNEESDSICLLVADDDDFEDIEEEEEEEDDIKVPDYMKPGPGQTLVEYREE